MPHHLLKFQLYIYIEIYRYNIFINTRVRTHLRFKRMASIKGSLIAAAVLLLAMLLPKLMVHAFDDAIAPSPAMATGSAFASSASVYVIATSALFYVCGLLLH